MGKPTLRERLKTLEATIAAQEAAIAANRQVHERVLQGLKATHAVELRAARQERDMEQRQRVAAQRGLTPYVYAVEALNQWLKDHEEVRGRMEVVMRDLGLWDVKVGYDPDKDKALSIIWAKGRST